MTLEVRRLKDEEMDAAELISQQAFGGQQRFDIAPHMERIHALYKGDDYIGAFEDDALTAMMRIIPTGMHINGATLPLGAVSPVASSALHRRKGHADAMLRQSLEEMRERGQVLSGLWTPHPALYRRYGWEIAGEERVYEFAPKDLQLTVQPSQRGRLRFVEADHWQDLDAIFRRNAELSNGPMDRDEFWWRNWVLRNWNGALEGVIWQSDTGEDEGYALYADLPPRPGSNAGRVIVIDFVSLTSDAYLNLLTVMAQNDIRESIELHTPVDDPLLLLFADAERVQMRQRYTVLLRLVDVAEAIRQRPILDEMLYMHLSIEVTDSTAPWNNGRWLIQVAGGKATVEPTTGPADIAIDALHLAPVFNGYISPRRAAASGLLRAESEEAIAVAEAVFATHQPPYFPDRY